MIFRKKQSAKKTNKLPETNKQGKENADYSVEIQKLKEEKNKLKQEIISQKEEIAGLKEKIQKDEKKHSSTMDELFNELERSEIGFSLQEENRIKDYLEFFHEIINPLNISLNYMDDFLDKVSGYEELSIVRSLLAKLVKEIANSLEEERLNIGFDDYDHEQISDFTNIVKGVVDLYRPAIDKKGINLIEDISEDIYIKADPVAIEKITTNLLENAIKFTSTGGQILVHLQVKKDKTILTIKDDGVGIPSKDLKHIFKPFYRLNTNNAYEGFGLGLSLVKKIVESVQGEITASSDLKKGAEFNVIIDKYELTGNDKVSKHVLCNDTLPDKFVEADDVVKGGKRDSLLIVEDNLSMQNYLQKEFKINYNMYFAKNGEEALNKLGKLQTMPDMIISDILMEKMDGLEFKKTLGSIEKYRHIPFIFLTAKALYKDKIEGMELGPVDYIYKPFKLAELKTKIENILSNNKAQKSVLIKSVCQANSIATVSDVVKSEMFEEKCKKFDLTRTEKRVMELLLLKRQKANEIADTMNIAVTTVRKHLNNIYRKMDVNGKEKAEEIIFNVNSYISLNNI